MKKAIVGAVLAALLSGCLNVVSHFDHGSTYEPYESTKAAACGFVEAFSVKPEWHSGNVAEARISHAYAVFILPFSAIALPCEGVADTVTWPYDAW